MQKNVAGQKWRVFAFKRTDNTPVTGDQANITAKIAKDWGSKTPVTDTNPTEAEDGYYEFDISQAESNGNVLDLYPESSTGDVQVIGVPGSLVTTAPNFSALGIESDGDLTQVNDVANDVGITQAGADKAWSSAARTLTSFGTLVADIWASVSRTLTAGTNIVLAKGVGITGLNDLSLADIEATTVLAKAGADGDTLKDISDQIDAIPAVTVLSNVLGTINVSYAEESGSITIKRGDVINVPVIIQDDLTGRTLFYGARKSPNSSSYTMGDDSGGANEIKCINISIVDGVTTAFIPFDGDNNDVTSCTYKSEIEVRDADGTSNPVTGISFDTIVKGDIIR